MREKTHATQQRNNDSNDGQYFSAEIVKAKRKLWRALIDKRWLNFFGTPPIERFPSFESE